LDFVAWRFRLVMRSISSRHFAFAAAGCLLYLWFAPRITAPLSVLDVQPPLGRGFRPELNERGAKEWQRLHQFDVDALKRLRLAGGPGRGLVLMGDSITEGWDRPFFRGVPGGNCSSGCGIGTAALGVLSSGLGVETRVFAIGGDCIEDLHHRLFVAGGADALREAAPRCVVLTIGTNDLKHDTAEIAVEELRRLVASLRQALHPSTQLVLHGLLPRATHWRSHKGQPTPWSAASREKDFVEHVNAAQRQIAADAGDGVTYMDCGPALLQDGQLTREVFPDMLHLTSVGYKRWGQCLLGHLRDIFGASPAQVARPRDVGGDAQSAPMLQLIPKHAQVAPPQGALPEDPIELLWQRPSGDVRAVVVLLHGCAHQATDWWPREHCGHCLGLPEEVTIVRTVLRRGFAGMAVTSADRMSGCWTKYDIPRVEAAVAHMYREEGLSEDVPLYAFGASSGGAFVGHIAKSAALRGKLRCRIPQIMAVPGASSFSAQLPNGEQATWPAPPTLFIHMPRDGRTAGRVTQALRELWDGGIVAAELHCDPQPITADFFSSRMDNVSAAQSRAMADALRQRGILNESGYLVEDPRAGNDWRAVLAETGVPQALEDTLEPDGSRLSEEFNLAAAKHEMCATHAEAMLDFCEDPAGACERHRWTCRAPHGGG